MPRTAVILFNLGGPDSPAAVEPFLFNLFNDPAIIGAPGPVRYFLAKLISRRRAPIAREIYANLGGASPLLPNTQVQADALEASLGYGFKCFISMRYWHPMTGSAVRDVKAWGPDRIVLLPLYPQFSTTTSGSSIKAWQKAARRSGLVVPTTAVCCYPELSGFVEAVAARIEEAMAAGNELADYRILFSAHGLPEKIVEGGDPYQWQIERSVVSVIGRLFPGGRDPDFRVCYQSRVGPLKWIGPDLDTELRQAAVDKRNVLVVPIAFVSEHSETLVELDIEYREMARKLGIANYVRVPTVDAGAAYVSGLTEVVRSAAASEQGVMRGDHAPPCPERHSGCPLLEASQ